VARQVAAGVAVNFGDREPALDGLPAREGVYWSHRSGSFGRSIHHDAVGVGLGGERAGDASVPLEGFNPDRKDIGGAGKGG
jgi:hypothetical protein